MNSLQLNGGIMRKAIVAMILIATFGLTVLAQRTDPRQQGAKYGDPGFRGELVSLQVVNSDIRDILNHITDQYGINFILDKSVGPVPVTVNVNEVPWNMALDSILRSQELGVQVNGSILRIATLKTLATERVLLTEQQNTQMDLSPLYTEFIRLNYARAAGTLAGAAGGANSTTTGTSSNPVGSANSAGSSLGTGGAEDQGVLGIIKRRLSRRGAVEVDGRTNTLIVTDVRENIDAIRQLVFLLDQPEPQVEIEARIVVASRAFSREVGVQLAALVLGPRGSAAGGATMSGNQSGLTVPSGVRLPNGTINDALGVTDPSSILSLTTGIFGTAQISAMISAAENKNQAKVIATPRVTALNNRPAEIKSGLKIPVTTVQPGQAGGGGVAIATTEYIDVPLRLAVTPQITDVGTVILNIVAENSSLPVSTGTAAPTINTQSMTSQVTVPDGGTTVIGGVLSDSEQEDQDRTPGLSRIPLFGNLFKRKGVRRDTSEILFFITPRIYRPDFAGNPTSGKISDGTRTTTILQPVPLGNPASNSLPEPTVPLQRPEVLVPSATPATTEKQP